MSCSSIDIKVDPEEYAIGDKGKRKCGEVFYDERNNLSFCCYLCAVECAHMDSFLVHLLQHDLKVISEEDDAEDMNHITELDDSTTEFPPEVLLQDEEHSGNEDVNGISFEQAILPSAGVKCKPTVVRSSKPTTEGPLQCNFCPKTFEDTRKLKAHLTRHDNNRPYSCDLCEAKFNDNSNLKVHRNRHLGIKPYTCEVCQKNFISSTEMRLHKRSHTGEKPYMCNECGKCYKSSAHLTAHLRRHSNERPHVCKTCGKGYFEKKTLKEHELVHTGARPHPCSACPAAFSRRVALKEHMKLHSNVKRHVCKVCDKSFAQNAGLYSHMKRHNVTLKSDGSKF